MTTLFTVTTELIAVLVLNTQHRDARAMQLKLDELLRGVAGARSDLAGLEDRSEADLSRIKEGEHP